MEHYLKPDEQFDELFPNCRIIQSRGGFRYGTDAVLLAHFASPGSRDRHCDLGCGGGIIPLLLAATTPCPEITGVEILPAVCNRARRGVLANGLEGRIRILEGDYRDPALLPAASFTVVTANPPYQKVGAGLCSPDDEKRLSRTEVNATLPDVVAAAARLLEPGGRFCLVHRPERLADAICALRERGLEPKRLRLVGRDGTAAPSLFLLEALRGGRPALRILPPLLLTEAGGESPELRAIYRREETGR